MGRILGGSSDGERSPSLSFDYPGLSRALGRADRVPSSTRRPASPRSKPSSLAGSTRPHLRLFTSPQLTHVTSYTSRSGESSRVRGCAAAVTVTSKSAPRPRENPVQGVLGDHGTNCQGSMGAEPRSSMTMQQRTFSSYIHIAHCQSHSGVTETARAGMLIFYRSAPNASLHRTSGRCVLAREGAQLEFTNHQPCDAGGHLRVGVR